MIAIGSSPYRLYDELIGVSHGQTDHTLLAYGPDQIVLGYLMYSVFQGDPKIHSIFVYPAYRRRGVATALVLHLQRTFPHQRLDWGFMTPLGQRLHTHVTTTLASHSRSTRPQPS